MQCAGVVNLDLEVGTLISEGPLVFLGLPNAVKVVCLEPCKLYTMLLLPTALLTHLDTHWYWSLL